jgi:hypothetical protein
MPSTGVNAEQKVSGLFLVVLLKVDKASADELVGCGLTLLGFLSTEQQNG